MGGEEECWQQGGLDARVRDAEVQGSCCDAALQVLRH